MPERNGPRRWRGRWYDFEQWKTRRLPLAERIRDATDGAGNDEEVVITLPAIDLELLEWSLRRMHDLDLAERNLSKQRELRANAARVLSIEKGSWRFRKALQTLGLIPENDKSTYPSNLLAQYVRLVTSEEPVTLSTPFGMVFDDPEATVQFDECPMEPLAALRALRELYGAASDSACLKELSRQRAALENESNEDPMAAESLSVRLPKNSELI